ncbi:MAG TPA: hypothetical protein VKT32_00995 [Chthonomonadaceae bacterium]|nr:hypothetical protein [Chthonomonadaceae bacterium]
MPTLIYIARRQPGAKLARSRRPLLPGWMVPLAMLIFLPGISIPAGAQTPPSGSQPGTSPASPATPQAPEVSPKQAQEIKDALDDIAALRYLNALKLTPIQMDQLINAVTYETSVYQSKVNTMGATPLLKMLDEIRSVRQQALKGGDVPKDFLDRVKKVEEDFITRRAQLNDQYVRNITAALHRILKPEQITGVVALLRENYGTALKGNDDQFLNAFSLDVLIGNARALPVLKELRAAAKTNDTSGNGGGNAP